MGFMFKEPALIWRNLFSFFSRVSSLAYLSTKIYGNKEKVPAKLQRKP